MTIYYAQVESSACGEGLDASLLKELQVSGRSASLANNLLTTTSYCFMVASGDPDDQIVIWQAYQLEQTTTPPPIEDGQGPTVEIHRSKNILTIYSNSADLDQTTWRWQTFDESTNCQNQTLTQTSRNAALKIILREIDNSRYLCVSVKDKNNNPTSISYAIEGVDTTSPTISVQQRQRFLTAEANEAVSHWQHTYSPNDLACDAATFLNNLTILKSHKTTLTDDKMNYYYCFRAADKLGNYGYAKYRVQSVDFKGVVVRLKQDGLRLIVAPDNPISRWVYLKTSQDLSCDQTADFSQATTGPQTNKLELRTADANAYVCIKAFGPTNSTGYAKLRIAAQLSLKVDTNQISASSSASLSKWEYVKTEKEIECDLSNDSLFSPSNIDYYAYAADQKVELYQDDNEHWLCFRASNSNQSLILYGKKQIKDVESLRPNQYRPTTAQRDIVLLASLFIFAIILFFISKVKLAKRGRQRVDHIPTSTQKVKNKKSRHRQKQPKTRRPDPVQPLDFLKSDDEDQK